jgi:hypothetical protein
MILFTIPQPMEPTTILDDGSPTPQQGTPEQLLTLSCSRQVWEELGYIDDEVDQADDEFILSSFANHDVEDEDEWKESMHTTGSWTWFLEQVNNQDSSMDRCRTGSSTLQSSSSLCTCHNPTQPWDPENNTYESIYHHYNSNTNHANHNDMEYLEQWETTFLKHQEQIKAQNNHNSNTEVVPSSSSSSLDTTSDTVELILIGDSLIEHWNGTALGIPQPMYAPHVPIFDTLLRNNHETYPYVHTTLFGIAGDRCNQVLYRIQNNAVIPTTPTPPPTASVPQQGKTGGPQTVL